MLFQVFSVPLGTLEEKKYMVDLSVAVPNFCFLPICLPFLQRKPSTEILNDKRGRT
jgi:hypothetical protein